jgi:3-deoxy-7-phosphoheptulonate synthase
MTRHWAPNSWSSFPAQQQPPYPDPQALKETVSQLKGLPPLVSMGEVDHLQTLLSEAATGARFVLQGGDCAEMFKDCNTLTIMRKMKVLLQMSLVISFKARRPVLVLGRLAGQFAKPRSQDFENVKGTKMYSFRGDNVNSDAPDPTARTPNPARLLSGYFHAAATLNFMRALAQGGFSSIESSREWELDWVQESRRRGAFEQTAELIRTACAFFKALDRDSAAHRLEFFASHEGLVLPYEEAMTRVSRGGGPHYNLGGHFLWLGERTRQLEGAHVEYFRGIKNPIGLKLGPSARPEELIEVASRLDPNRSPGRLTVITRLGAPNVAGALPGLVRALQREGHQVVWSCDPMHGNTTSTPFGLKTRDFAQITSELQSTFEVHQAERSQLNAVHLELTGDDVTECTGGVAGVRPEHLPEDYASGCDPRLNYSQSLELAALIGETLHRQPT